MSCRFGGDATSPSKLWELCKAAKDAYSPIPDERFDLAGFYDERKGRSGKFHVKGGYFLKDISRFDSAFYNLTTDVADAMDPQVRMLLESVYESAEDAGIPLHKLAGSNTAVFAGSFGRDYNDMLVRDTESMHASTITGNGIAMLSNRISHFYDLRGASMTIDTGCSTGLVALHQAVHALRSGESDMAIVGSALVCLGPELFIELMGAGVLGPTGKCFAWDHRAEGYGRGEGVASLMLKPLDAALRDGDHIHAVIRETGLNQDGKTTTITSPSAAAQIDLILDVYRRAGLDPVDTGYVEAHMTGTPTGDPIEAEALAQTFAKHRSPEDPVWVGGVKPNIGHTEPVSGLAAIIKTIFVLKEGVIPPNVNYEKPNPKIPLSDWRLKVPVALTPWPAGKPRRASINNFGYGGTNAHVILEAAPDVFGYGGAGLNGRKRSYLNGYASSVNGTGTSTPLVSEALDSFVYVVSAKESGAAQQMNQNLAQHIRDAGLELAPRARDLAFTLAERRSRLTWVTALRAGDLAELAEKLDKARASRASKKPRLGFVFNGQGAQWYAMGRELIAAYPVFRRSLMAADAILRDYGATWSLREELMRDEKTTRVHEISISQPCSVALQLCLVDLLASWGITPSAVVSHSSGEIAAAYCVGALSFQQALGVVFYRGELAAQHAAHSSVAGSMLAAGVGAERAAEYVKNTEKGRVVVACHNSPESVTLSGDAPAIEEVRERLAQDGLFARKLNVPLAYHSHHMEPMAQDYSDRLREIVPPASAAKWNGTLYASPVTGDIVTSPKVLGPDHYCRNLVSPVLFAEAFERMCFSDLASDGTRNPSTDANVDMIVEIGAHGTLAGPIRQVLGKDHPMPYVSCLKRGANAVHTIQDAVCALLAQGYPVQLAGVNGHQRGHYVPGLPTYAWNHTHEHWTESRLSREFRHKRFPPHELLGSPVPGINRQSPTWRNILRTADIPWLVEHKLGSDVVLPGAGYIAMAIEAIRLVTDPNEATVAGYRLREVDFLNALVIPDRGVETQFVLRPLSDKELDSKGWYEFEVWSVSVGDDDSWTQHCKGTIAAEFSSEAKEAATRAAVPAPRTDAFFSAADLSVNDVHPESFFAVLRSMKLFHGPLFRNMVSSRASTEKSVTTLAVSPAAGQGEPKPYVLHPTTMDSLVHAAYVSIPAATMRGSMVVPRSVRHLYVPRTVNRLVGDKMTAFVNLQHADRRGALLSGVAVNGRGNDHDVSAPRLELDGLYCQAVPLETDSSDARQASPMCSTNRWEVDIAHGVPPAFTASLRVSLDENDAVFEKKLDRVSFNYVLDAVRDLSVDDEKIARPPHLAQLYTWMKAIVARAETGELVPGSRVWAKTNAGLKQRLADEVASENAAGKLTVRVGQQLAAIVRGHVDAKALLTREELDQYYESLPRLAKRSYEQVYKIAVQLAVNRPNARVLEVGGRSGALTVRVLEAFAAKAPEGTLGTLLGHYDFTSLNGSALDVVRQRCVPWDALMDFKTLDISKDPAEQGFTSRYDLVIVNASALGPDPAKSLSHVRTLVEGAGGKLVLILEHARPRLDTHVVFGGLAGFQFGEVHDWHELLTAAGFAGVELEVGDCDDAQFQASSVILSSAVEAHGKPPAYPTAVSVVHADNVRPEQQWLTALEASIAEELGATVAVAAVSQVEARPDVTYVFVPEMVSPFLDVMDEAAFNQLRALLVRGQGLLWLSRSGLMTADKPVFAQSSGLLRTARQEDPSKRYVLLDFDAEDGAGIWPLSAVEYVVRALRQSFDARLSNAEVEHEYAVKEGVMYVSRLYPNPAADSASSETPEETAPEEQPFWQAGRPLVWDTTKTIGTLSNLYFTDDAARPELPSGFVEIRTHAMGLNFRDVMCAMGQIDESRYMHDAAGVVTRLGPDTEASGLAVGDRVTGVLNGKFATHPSTHWTCLTKIPNDMSWEEAASLPIVFLTSYMCLFDLARLQRGERVLIHAGAGGVGQSAIMLARLAGAEVFATCSSDAKRQLLMTRFGLDADHIFSSRDTSFAPAILARTSGKGVDVVINSLSGPMLKASWDCVARFGRFCEIGKVDMEAARRLDLSPLTRNATIMGFDLIQHCQFNRPAVHRAWKALMKLWSAKVIRAVHPVVSYPLSDMETAMRQMQRGAHIGKLVLIPGEDTRVRVLAAPSSGLKAQLNDPTATYLIVGGLGGIGLAFAHRMMESGAKHILIISRQAESHAKAKSLIASGRAQGCTVWIRNCDVAREDQLVQVLANCTAAGMPPVRGVIQAALSLHDTILESLTFEQWQAGIRSKVAGTLNLHRHLTDVRFFIMLSSTAGVIGLASQSAYAAGNTFQDALARHRVSKGLPAVAIDLGGVDEVGFVAENGGAVRERVERTLGKIIPIARVLRLIEAAVCEPMPPTPEASQVITGIIDYDRLPAGAAVKQDPRFSTLKLGSSAGLRASSSAGAAATHSPDDALKQGLVAAATSPEARAAVVMAGLMHKLAALFNLAEAEIDATGSLAAVGVDSLVAVELRNWLSSVVQAHVTVFEILQAATLREFAALVARRSTLVA
ncbi:polyketide synthase [Thermothielavioides terrestris NRRL 8126]|uniref:Polyketide synthase n=1 Tax=Thermothielavioides terrestris (strain ATCC 38088 / NRRL 8126) TaxID=578455 RepID=G2R8J3_THETT|nr:polyketide synthase [Thermothielavioides terrestris NRRL 8126]AEO67408.1 polyketide synthase [Thermothielavioides terrestris NRRL 8126]